MPSALTFLSDGVRLAGLHFPAAHSGLASPTGRPAVVMAHGFGATVDSGLEPFAEALAAAGLDVLAFDYRGFGASEGAPRQVIDLAAEVADYRAALRTAATLPGVDPHRLVLWGVSLSGGLVLEVAAGRNDLAAVVAVTPFVSGAAAARHAGRSSAGSSSTRTFAKALQASVGKRLGRGAVYVPLVGAGGLFSMPGYREAYEAIAGPSWRNEVDAAIVAEILNYRPIRFAAQMPCPALFQVADFDRAAPPGAAMKAAVKARAQVRHYPADHFDVYPGNEWHDAVVQHQVRFLTRTLAPLVIGV